MILTPQLRAEIKAAFLRWFQGQLKRGSINSAALKRALESLIRYRFRTSLDPAPEKSPVLGGVGVAFGPVPTFDGVPCPFKMDTGFLVLELYFDGLPKPFPAWSQPWGAAGAAGLIPPLLVYTGNDLQEYLAGPGTSVPGGGSEYLIGEASEDASQACPQNAGLSITDWPDTAPSLSAALQSVFGWEQYDAYASSVYDDYNSVFAMLASCGTPGEHSGLLKLAVQAKLGAGKSPVGLAVWTETLCPLKPGRDGIFRGPDGVYWLIKIDGDGCHAQRMKVNACTICINDWITNGLVTGSDLIKAQAFVFAGLSPDYAYAQVELLSADDVDEIYEKQPLNPDNRVREPLGDTEWHYSHGYLGTGEGATHEAAVVTHELYNDGIEQYRLSTIYKVSFTLGTGTISASLSSEEVNTRWEPAINDLIYYPIAGVDGSKICYVQRDLISETNGEGEDVALYCWYTREGLEVIRYSYRVGSAAVSDPTPTEDLCGPGVYNNVWTQFIGGLATSQKGEIYAERADFSVGTQVLLALGTQVIHETTLQASGGGGCGFRGTIPTQTKIWANGHCNNIPVSETDQWASAADLAFSTGSGSGSRIERRSQDVNSVRLAIIPHGESECCYLVEILTFVQQYQQDQIYDDASNHTPPRVLSVNTALSNGVDATINHPIDAGSGSLYVTCGGDVLTNELHIQSTSGPYGDGQTINTIRGALITNHGIFGTQDGYLGTDYNDWAEWITYTEQVTTNCGPVTMWTSASYQYPDIYYSNGPSISKKLIGQAGWPENASNDGYAINAPGLFTRVAFCGWN